MKKLDKFDDELLLDFGGRYYIMDFDAASDSMMLESEIKEEFETETYFKIDENGNDVPIHKTVRSKPKSREINVTKYELLRWLATIVLDDDLIVDDTLGIDHALKNASLSFKMAFNTLVANGIIKEIK